MTPPVAAPGDTEVGDAAGYSYVIHVAFFLLIFENVVKIYLSIIYRIYQLDLS